MSARPSHKLVAYVSLSSAALLAAVLFQTPAFAVLAAPFALVIVLGLSLERAPSLRAAFVLASDSAMEGDTLELRLELRSNTTIDRLVITHALPNELVEVTPSSLAVRLDRSRDQTVTTHVRCERWGGYRLGAVSFRARGAFGMVAFDHNLTATSALRVFPSEESLRTALLPRATQAFAGNERSLDRGDGIEFADTRPYLPGDPARRVNWRLSSTHRELHVDEFHPERSADVVLFLDTFGEVWHEGGSSLDLLVSAAASLARYYLARRDRVGVVSFGGSLRWIVPGSGTLQLYRILEVLIETQVFTSYAWKDLTVVPPRMLPPRAQVIAVTTLTDERAIKALRDLRARGFDLSIIEISPVEFVRVERQGNASLPFRVWQLQREALRESFVEFGVPVGSWKRFEPLAPPIERMRLFRQRARWTAAR